MLMTMTTVTRMTTMNMITDTIMATITRRTTMTTPTTGITTRPVCCLSAAVGFLNHCRREWSKSDRRYSAVENGDAGNDWCAKSLKR